jgi:hypothetical protein
MVLKHCSFSLHTTLEGPWLHKTAFPTPMVRLLDESQGSSPLQGHSSWLMCEVAMSELVSHSDVWGPLHTQDWELLTITLHALLLVEKAESVQVRFTLRLRDQWSMWEQHGFLHDIKWIIFHGHLDYFQTHLLEVGLTQNRETIALWFILFYHVWGPAWI